MPFRSKLPISESCPACVFERNRPGRPVKQHDNMTCLECGSIWKEVAAATQPSVSRAGDLCVFRAVPGGQDEDCDPDNPDWDPIEMKGKLDERGPVRIGGLLLAGFFLLLAALQFSTFVEPLYRQIETTGPRIGSVELQEHTSPAGGKVFTVRGNLSNPTGHPQNISRIAIVLRKNNGIEVLRWYHRPSRPVLNPGKDLRFASSVYHPAALAAYAEAHIASEGPPNADRSRQEN